MSLPTLSSSLLLRDLLSHLSARQHLLLFYPRHNCRERHRVLLLPFICAGQICHRRRDDGKNSPFASLTYCIPSCYHSSRSNKLLLEKMTLTAIPVSLTIAVGNSPSPTIFSEHTRAVRSSRCHYDPTEKSTCSTLILTITSMSLESTSRHDKRTICEIVFDLGTSDAEAPALPRIEVRTI